MSGALISAGTMLDARGEEALDAAEGVIDMANICQTRSLLVSERDVIERIRAKPEQSGGRERICAPRGVPASRQGMLT